MPPLVDPHPIRTASATTLTHTDDPQPATASAKPSNAIWPSPPTTAEV